MLEALDAVVRRGAFAGAIQLARNGPVERVDQKRRLAAAGDSRHAGEQAQRDFGRDVLQIIAARVHHLEGAAMVRRPPAWHQLVVGLVVQPVGLVDRLVPAVLVGLRGDRHA